MAIIHGDIITMVPNLLLVMQMDCLYILQLLMILQVNLLCIGKVG